MENEARLNDEIGEVLKIENNEATVLFDRHAACASCKACGLFSENQKKVAITLPAPADLNPGDKVRLFMDQRYYSVSLLLLYCVPCVALVLGIVAGTLIFGKDGALWTALLGLGLTAASYLILRTQDKKLAKWKRGKLSIQKVTPDVKVSAEEEQEA